MCKCVYLDVYKRQPLWYLYMLIGIYFIIPILNSWLEGAKKREIQVFLGIWVISLVIPYLKMLAPLLGYTGNYGNMGLFGVCDWNVYGTFYYVSGFIGYIIPVSYTHLSEKNQYCRFLLGNCTP